MRRAALRTILFLLGTTSATAVAAGAPAFYHPDDVAARSQRFREVSASMRPRFEEADAQATKWQRLVDDLELGTALLGADATTALRDHTAATRRSFAGQFLKLNRFAGLVQEDYSRVFEEAMGRVKPKVVGDRAVKECTSGASSMGMLRGPGCTGEDLNPAFAAALDADETLRKEVASIGALEWPTIQLPSTPQAPVAITGTAATVDLATVAHRLAEARVRARKDELELALEPLQDGLDAKDPAAIQKGEQARQRFTDALAADGAALRAVVRGVLDRGAKGTPAAVGWCANPVGLGGCGVPDVTAEVLAVVGADKKAQKEIEALAP